MVEIQHSVTHTSGMPLGGIGAGSVELRPDGVFHEWQMFNSGIWSPASGCGCHPGACVEPDDLFFLLRTAGPEEPPRLRYLNTAGSFFEPYSFSWLRCVESVCFRATFPLAELTYCDPDIPVEVQATFCSPFIAGDTGLSATPGFLVRFELRNPTTQPVSVSLVGNMMNLSGLGQATRRPHNQLQHDHSSARVLFAADGLDERHCSTGTLALGISGHDISVVNGSYRWDRGLHRSDATYGMMHHSCLRQLRQTGRLPNWSVSTPLQLSEEIDFAQLDRDALERLFEEWVQHPFVAGRFATVSQAIPQLREDPRELRVFLEGIHVALVREYYGHRLCRQPWGAALLCDQMELLPGETAQTWFAVGWFLPNHYGPSGNHIGHYYENRFSDAGGVADLLLTRRNTLLQEATLLPELLGRSSLDAQSQDAISSQLTTLIKSSWYTRSGDFAIWEGLGCCGLHTTDITYQGSFPIIALLADLQLRQMEMGAHFQRQDGRVHHLFTPDLSAVDGSFERVDMNPQFVMLVARDFQWTGDWEYLRRMWPAVVSAMDSTQLLDHDGDGLPDADTRRNTYDAWDFCGCTAYISSLWLGALQAAARLAQAMQDGQRYQQWGELLNQGRASLERQLWNGMGYDLWFDPATGRRDQGCMSDQLSGDWFAACMGWPALAPADRIRTALKTIMTCCFRPDTGLLNATYPPGIPPVAATHAGLQSEATWTGIEYTVAALMQAYGMEREAHEIIADIHQRHLRHGRFFNHCECGDHYYRAMSSWTLLLTTSGFEYDCALGRIGFRRPGRWPILIPGAVGEFICDHEDRASIQLSVLRGQLRLQELLVPRESAGLVQSGSLNGQPVTFSRQDTLLRFAQPLCLDRDSVLELR